MKVHPRIRRVSWALALVYLPQLLPYVLGPLRECSHCIKTYSALLTVVPGAFLALASTSVTPRHDTVMLVAAGAGTLLVLVLAYRVVALEGLQLWILAGGIAVLLAAQALGFAQALRA